MTPTALEWRQTMPSSFVKRINDFDQVVQLFSQWEGRLEQLTCGRFEATFLMARGRTINAHRASANQALSIRGREGPDLCTFTLVLPESARCVWHKRQLEPGCLVVRGGDVEIEHQTAKTTTNISFTLAEKTIRSAARTLNGIDPGPLGWQVLKPAPEHYDRLEERIRRFLCARSSVGFADLVRLEEECVVAAVAAAFPHAGSHRMDLPYPARARLVHRAEELMRTRIGEPLGEIDLCSALAVSGRTLRLAFREQFGLGPMTYLQTLRLNSARTALKAADPEALSVAAVARNFGFHHLGKFAGYYRRLFGEPPSGTLLKRSLP